MSSYKRKVQSSDIYQLKSVTDPQWNSENGKYAFVETAISEGKNGYISNLFVGDLQSGTSQFTFGENKTTTPRWSLCGKKLVYISDKSGVPQIYLIGVEGGEAVQLTQCINGVRNPVWSPCGTKLIFTTSLTSEEDLFDGGVDKQEEKQLHTQEYLVLVHLETNQFTLLVEGNQDFDGVTWSPDGGSIAFATYEGEGVDIDFVQDVYMLIYIRKKGRK